MMQTPPGSFRRKADEEGISTAQAAAVIAERYGLECTPEELTAALRAAGLMRRWSEWFVLPEDIAWLAGALQQRRAPWWRKGIVRGDVVAEIVGLFEQPIRMMVAYERVFDPKTRLETKRLYERMPCVEWPTGRVTGWLTLDPDQEEYEMTARYLYTRA